MLMSVPPKVYISVAVSMGVLTAVAHAAVGGGNWSRDAAPISSGSRTSLPAPHTSSDWMARRMRGEEVDPQQYFFDQREKRQAYANDPLSFERRYVPNPPGKEKPAEYMAEAPHFQFGEPQYPSGFQVKGSSPGGRAETMSMADAGAMLDSFSYGAQAVASLRSGGIPQQTAAPEKPVVDIPGVQPTSPVPEPSTYLMLAAALALISGAHIKRHTR